MESPSDRVPRLTVVLGVRSTSMLLAHCLVGASLVVHIDFVRLRLSCDEIGNGRTLPHPTYTSPTGHRDLLCRRKEPSPIPPGGHLVLV